MHSDSILTHPLLNVSLVRLHRGGITALLEVDKIGGMGTPSQSIICVKIA